MPEITTAELLEQIRSIFDSRIEKMEQDLKQSIGVVASRLEDLNVRHSESAERLTAVETKVATCEQARIDQGRRLGELERTMMRMETRIETREETREKAGQNAGNWARWVPSVIFGLLGAAGVIVALLK